MTLTAATTTATSFDLGPARALSCRECGHEIPLAPEVFAGRWWRGLATDVRTNLDRSGSPPS